MARRDKTLRALRVCAVAMVACCALFPVAARADVCADRAATIAARTGATIEGRTGAAVSLGHPAVSSTTVDCNPFGGHGVASFGRTSRGPAPAAFFAFVAEALQAAANADRDAAEQAARDCVTEALTTAQVATRRVGGLKLHCRAEGGEPGIYWVVVGEAR